MASAQTKFKQNDEVLVPAARMADPDRQPAALVRRKVLSQTDRSIRVDDGQGGTVEVASRLAHPSTWGFLVLRIGDLASESQLLDPLAKSVVQFMRLLVPGEDLRFVELRTLAELDTHWTANHGGTSHVVIVGHGVANGLQFMADGGLTTVTGKALAERLRQLAPNSAPKTFISLACRTGPAAFGKPFSQSAICRDFIGPRDEVHGAAASQFCQSLLSEHVLDGVEIPWAYNRARQSVVKGRRFIRWRDGKMHTPRT
jgi:hypothetical protein